LLLQPVLQGDAEMAVGSRFLEAEPGVPHVRRLGLRAITLLSNLGSGVSLSDSQMGFRAFSGEAVQRMFWRAQGFSVESEMQFLAQHLGLRISEVPVSIDYEGAPKRNVLGQGLQVLNGILRPVGQYRPLLFLGLPGLVMLLIGLWWGYRVMDIYRRAQELAVGYALLAVLFAILGSVTLSTGITLHSLRGLLLELLGPRET